MEFSCSSERVAPGTLPAPKALAMPITLAPTLFSLFLGGGFFGFSPCRANNRALRIGGSFGECEQSSWAVHRHNEVARTLED